jgi:hypothetical protein
MPALLLAETSGLVNQSERRGMFVGWLVMRTGVEMEVSVNRFIVYIMA